MASAQDPEANAICESCTSRHHGSLDIPCFLKKYCSSWRSFAHVALTDCRPAACRLRVPPSRCTRSGSQLSYRARKTQGRNGQMG